MGKGCSFSLSDKINMIDKTNTKVEMCIACVAVVTFAVDDLLDIFRLLEDCIIVVTVSAPR